MKRDKLLEQAISEAEAFLLECKAYQRRINESYTTTYGGKPEKRYDDACVERGTLKARSLLLIRKLQAWRKSGNVE
jgi:hypothetical protein